MEALLELLGEILLQAGSEALVELGWHAVAAPFRRERSPWLAALGHLLIGAIVGAISLLVLDHHLVATGPLRVVNLIVTPVLAGVLMMALGRWRVRRGDPVLRIDRFVYGYLFALGLALVRFQFTV